MKIHKRALHEALTELVRVVDHKSDVSALKHVKLSASMGTLTVTAANLKQTLTAEIQGDGELTVCLPAKTLANLVKPENKKDDGEVVIEVRDESSVFVTVDSLKTVLATVPVEDFPADSSDEFNLVAFWPAAPLRTSLGHVLPAASDDVTRPHINSVSLGEAIAATDGHRLHVSTLPTALAEPLLLPVPAATTLQRILKTADNVVIARSDDRVKVRAGAWTMESKLVDEQFPPIDQVIPKRSRIDLVVEADLLKRSLKHVGKVSTNGAVKMRVNGVIELSSTEVDCSASVIVEPLENTHPADDEDLIMGVNMAYLVDAVAREKGKVKVRLNGPLDPILVECDDRLSVVMPMRV